MAHEKKLNVGFLDPQSFSATMFVSDSSYATAAISQAMKHDFVVGAHNTGGHWILVVIAMDLELVWYIDSAKTWPRRKFKDVQTFINW